MRTGSARPSISATAAEPVTPRHDHTLTPREIQVLQHVAGGATNKEIAADLGVAVSTVERHLVNLYTKIGARGRADAVAYALRAHVLDRPS
jgi:DNA-binding NarL/FixJ family response regulator